MGKKVYIVIINFKGDSDTIECLETVFKSSYLNFQVIVVDNSESDTSLNAIAGWAQGSNNKEIATNFKELVFPLIQKPVDFSIISEGDLSSKQNKLLLIQSKKNNGFAAANNVALKYIKATGEIDSLVWLLNNDTVIETATLQEIVTGIDESPDKGNTVFGTPLLEYYSPLKIQAIGGIYDKHTGRTSHVGEGLDTEKFFTKQYIKSLTIDYPVGASMAVKHNFLETVGLLNEEYFLYYEEIDWVARARAAGGGSSILPVYGVYHKQGKSTVSALKKSKPEFIDLLSLKNRISYAGKYNKENVNAILLSIATQTIAKRLLAGNFKIIPKITKLLYTAYRENK